MFGIGLSEFIVIVIVALIAIGPDKLPELAKTLGKAFSEFKKAGEEVKKSFRESARPQEEGKSPEGGQGEKPEGRDGK
ncbi:MAG: twin-arginine translocase TatA/TatE family subunit [Deltaproteobacteria bacterium]|nr:twin-arginine translocase TatA/TatE family subunit [Deltaproteobacteria bacterium]